jgi:prophage antirepressor-like protein
METEIIPYVFEDELVRVRRDENGDPWFVAKDVCRVLGIANHKDAVSRLDEDERAGVGITDPSSNGVEQERTFTTVSESGLYALIFKSRKPQAKTFRKWVTSEVLPAIRKTGRYEGGGVADREALLESIKEQAGRISMRTTQRVSMLNIALQVCKAEGAADELTVLARYVSMCDAVLGKQAEEAKEKGELALVDHFIAECCEKEEAHKINATVLYRYFTAWCKDRGIRHPPSMAWFGRQAGQRLRRIRSGTVSYCDVRLLN